MKTILITGGAGYLGSKLAGILLRNGYKVISVDNLMHEQSFIDQTRLYQNHGKNYSFHLLDVRNSQAITELFRQHSEVSLVVHFGDLSSVYACNHNPTLTNEICRLASRSIIELSFANGIPLIYNSSSSIYGASKVYKDWKESDTLPSPGDLYCESKIYMEEQIQFLASGQPSARFIILRPATVFGESPRFRIELLPNHFCFSALVKGRIQVSDANSNRAFVSTSTLCNAYLKIIENDIFPNDVFNIGTYNLSKLELSAEIQRQVKCKIITSEEHGDPRDLRIDCSKFSSQLFKLPQEEIGKEIRELCNYLTLNLQVFQQTNFAGLLNMPLDRWVNLI
jgi:nucleoside-diphosphate-sugar epimerase